MFRVEHFRQILLEQTHLNLLIFPRYHLPS